MNQSAEPQMHFGMFDWLDENRNLTLAEMYDQRLAMAELADELGFWCYHVAEHHGTPLCMWPSPNLMLSAMAQRTSRLRLGPLVQLITLYHPVRVIEEICMLDNLSHGRLELGFGRGTSASEVAMFNVDHAESRDIYREAQDIILAGLTQDVVDYEGHYFNVRNLSVPMRPFQKPYPPLWYPTSNPDSVPWVGAQGFNTLFSFTFPSIEQSAEQIAIYRANLETHQHDAGRLNGHVASPKWGFNRHIYIADTDAQALEEARVPHAEFTHNYTTRPNLPTGGKDRDRVRPDFDAAVQQGMIFVGSPDTVRQQVQRYVDVLGVNYVVGVFGFGNMTTEQILHSMRLFGEEVMPHIQPPASLRAPAGATVSA